MRKDPAFRILAQGHDVYAYFKHEEEGKAPAYAEKLLAAKS